MTKEDIALKELELLQAIIARQDDFKERTKAIVVAIISALTAAMYSEDVGLPPKAFLVMALSVAGLFAVLESVYGITEINAETRVKKIEKFLRDKSEDSFTTPCVCDSLITPTNAFSKESWLLLWSSFMRWRTLIPSVGLCVVSIGIYFVRDSQVSANGVDLIRSPVVETSLGEDIDSLSKRVAALKNELRELRSIIGGNAAIDASDAKPSIPAN